MRKLLAKLALALALGGSLVGVSALADMPPAPAAHAAYETCGHQFPQGIHRVSSTVVSYHSVVGFIRSSDGRLVLTFTTYSWRYKGNGTYGWVPTSSRQLVCGIWA